MLYVLGAILLVIIVVVIALLIMGIRIIRPTHRGLVERLGKYNRYCDPGLHIIIPLIERLFQIDVREVLVEAQPQTIITNDNLNAKVDAQVDLKVKAENEKIAAVDFATATETQADGQRRAEIKKAEGIKQAKILAAEGEAQAIKLVNEAAELYFVGNAQVLRKLETVEKAFWQNAKIIVPANGELVNVIGDLAGIAPVPVKAAVPNPTPGQPTKRQA